MGFKESKRFFFEKKNQKTFANLGRDSGTKISRFFLSKKKPFLPAIALLLAAAAPIASDTFFGTTVQDPYRWLENPADPKVQAWSDGEDARARAYLDALPVRAGLHRLVETIMSKTSPAYRGLYPAGGKIFATYAQPPKQQPMVAVLGQDADPADARVVVDPNVLDPSGHTAIDWWVPSPDGSKVAVSLSQNGSEDGTLHVFDVATGHDSGLLIPRVQFPTASGSLAWRKDGSGFWYTRFPGADEPAERQHFYQQVFYHTLGADPAKDSYVAGRDFPKVAEIALSNAQSPGPVLMSVANGDGGEFAQYVIADDGSVTQVATDADKAIAGAFGPDGTLYLVSRQTAPRGQLLALAPGDRRLGDARVLVPQDDGVIEGGGEFGGAPVTVTKTALYLRELVGGPSRVVAYGHDGKRLADLPLPPVAAVSEVAAVGDAQVLYSVTTYLTPPVFERYDEATRQASASKLFETSPASFADAVVTRGYATSKDGTKVPLNIVSLKTAKRDDHNPTLLYGYGGYSVSEVPRYLGALGRSWLNGGGVIAFANLRGGGEYGEAWHDAGALTHKQNVFDDFDACATYLIAQHWTTPGRLAALGGSNGGLLMGAMMTQHPQTFRAVVSLVGIYDMLRVELDPNGAFNTTEFGTVKNQAQFNAMLAYSPYQHVRAGAAYPAIFMATGTHDGRVNPLHSRKMIAALQAASTSKLPILLSINSHAGHGIGSSMSIRVDQMSDYLAFLFDQLHMTLR